MQKMARRGRKVTDHAEKLARRLRRGTMPQNARAAGVRFTKGHPKRGGRKKGAPNIMTRDIQEALIAGTIASGYDKKGKDGLTGFFKRTADTDVKTHSGMLRAMMPMKIDASIRHEKPYLTEAEVLVELNARGLPPQTLFQLRYHEVPAEDFDPYGEDGDKVVDLQPLKPKADGSQ
jgi:hypothetical protein